MKESFALPDGWMKSTLGEVCEPSQYGYTAKAGPDGSHKFLRTTDITKENIDWGGVPYCSMTDEEAKKYLLRDGDIVISRAGSIGFSKLIKSPPPKCVFASYLIRFRPLINPKYVSYYLLTQDYWSEINAGASGIAVQNVNASMLSQIGFPVAPENQQNQIVEKLEELLSDLDDGVAELKAAQAKLMQCRQSLLKSAVEGSLTAEWRAKNKPTETGEQLLKRILTERRKRWEKQKLAEFREKGQTPPKDWQRKYPEPVAPDTSELPELPEGWVWASLDMLGEIVSGVTKGTKRKTPQKTLEVPYLRVANVQRGYLDLSEVKTIEATVADIEKYALQARDVLFNEGGDRDKLGRGWVWEGQIEGCIHQNHVFRLRLYIRELIPELISHYGNTFGKLWFQNAGKQTTNLASINRSILQAFPVPVAPLDEQKQILSALNFELSKLDAQEKTTEASLGLSEAQRKNILKGAFAGKLVEQDPLDEPAEMLMHRIRTERRGFDKQPKTRKINGLKSIEVSAVKRLEEFLKEKGDWVSAQEAFRECGVTDGSDIDVIEELYVQLRKLDKRKRLAVKREGSYDKIKYISDKDYEISGSNHRF